MTWVDGAVYRPTTGLGPAGCRALGHALGNLHTAAQTVPLVEELPRWDAAALTSESSPLRPGPLDEIFSTSEVELLRDVEGRATEAFARLAEFEESRGLIHADFILGNCLLRRRGAKWSVGVIDLDDCGMGYFAYDVATLADNLADFPGAARNIGAFLDGYRMARRLPPTVECELPVLMAARHAASCLWAAAVIRRGAPPQEYRVLIAGRIEQIRRRLAASVTIG